MEFPKASNQDAAYTDRFGASQLGSRSFAALAASTEKHGPQIPAVSFQTNPRFKVLWRVFLHSLVDLKLILC